MKAAILAKGRGGGKVRAGAIALPICLTRFGALPMYRSVMRAGSPLAFTLLRVPRGDPRPSDEEFLNALARDREQLHLPAANGASDFAIAGPYAILVDGSELDEWVVWEK